MFGNLVSTFGELLYFQFHCGKEIVYFSRDFSTTFIQYIQHTEVSANQLKSNRCFHCARLNSMYWNSVSTFGAHFQFQYHCWKEIVYFSRDFSTAFIHIIHYIPNARRTSWSQTDAFIVQDWNRYSENQYPLLGHFFIYSSTAVKR